MVDESPCTATEVLLLEAPPDALTIDALPPHVADCPRCRALLERVRADHDAIAHAVEGFAHAQGFDTAFAAALSEASSAPEDASVAAVEESPRLAPRVDGPPSTTRNQARVVWALAASVGVLAVLVVVGLAAWFTSLPTSIEVFGSEDAEQEAGLEWKGTGREAADRGRVDASMSPVMGWEEVYDPELEEQAILGELPEVQRARLDALVDSERTAHEVRARASRVLMVDAFSAGDQAVWKDLMERHLNWIESSDPDLIYKYALHLTKVGGDPETILHWCDRALSRRSAWDGDTRTARSYSLYKIRVRAAQERWKAQPESARARDAFGRLSLDWLRYADRVDRDPSTARDACLAAWDEDACRPDAPVPAPLPEPEPTWSGLDDPTLDDRAKAGQLHPIERAELELLAEQVDGRISRRDRANRLLMDDAFSDGRRHEWETRLRYHLAEISQADPDLCYEAAFHAWREDQADVALHWSAVALLNRTVWTGALYESRVHDLYALRARAAAERRGSEAAAAAREWLEFASVVGRDTEAPRELCESVAPDRVYCTAGLDDVPSRSGRGSVFEDIEGVLVREIATEGLVERALTDADEERLTRCLYETREIDAEQARRDLLRTTYLLEITDRGGPRSFELYTMENLKGNGGRYYDNGCLHDLVAALDP